MTAGTPSSRPRRKIVHVSTAHQAGDVRVFVKECRTVAAAGYNTALYARAACPAVIDEVRVVPVSEARGRVGRMTVAVWRLLRPLWRERADLYHLHDPELIPLGVVLRAFGRTVVYDAHEDLPAQVLGKSWIPRPARPAVGAAARLLVRLAGRALSGIVAATPTIAQGYVGARVATVGNFPIVFDGAPVAPHAERRHAMAYVGGVAEIRGLSTMLRVARSVRARTGHPLILAGPFQPAGLVAEIHPAQVIGDVLYLGILEPTEARKVMGESRVGLLLYRPSKAHEDAMPNKLFEYMAEGVPVVASDFPLWRKIVEETGAGVVVRPDDADAVTAAVLGILGDPAKAAVMGDRGRKAVAERFAWDVEAGHLLGLYADLIGPPAGPAT